MDFFNKAVSSVTHQSEEPKGEGPGQKHSTTDLFSSAQVVAGAAQATLSNQSDKIDKKVVAGAAGDLLGAAKEYGKLEEGKGLGLYVGQAESYLRSYGAPPPPAADAPAEKVAAAPDSPAPATADPPAPASTDPPAPAAEAPASAVADPPAVAVEEEEKKVVEEVEEKKEGGGAGAGAGDYFKMAEGFLKK